MSTSKDPYSATPWRIAPHGYIVDANGNEIFTIITNDKDAQRAINAVHAHDALLGACEMACLLMAPGNDPNLGNKGPYAECVTELRAAIAKARGEARCA